MNHPSTKETSPKNNEQTPPPTIGTHLELVDDDEDYSVNAHHTGDTTGDITHTVHGQPVTETRRYPTRHHRPPTRLQDYIRS